MRASAARLFARDECLCALARVFYSFDILLMHTMDIVVACIYTIYTLLYKFIYNTLSYIYDAGIQVANEMMLMLCVLPLLHFIYSMNTNVN